MTEKDYIHTFTDIYSDIPESKQQKADELIRRLADTLVLLDECKEHLRDEGAVTEMSQGSYAIMRENPYSKIFDAKSKVMLSIIDKLDKMQPVDNTGQKDELLEFIGR